MHVHVYISTTQWHKLLHYLFIITTQKEKKKTTKTTPIMPTLLRHNAFTNYAQNYAGIICMSLLVSHFLKSISIDYMRADSAIGFFLKI